MSDMCNSTDAIASKNTKYQRNIVCYLTKKGIFSSQFIHNTKWKPHVVRNHEGHHYKAYDSIFKESLDYFDNLFLDLCTKLVLVMIKIRFLVQELLYKTVLGLLWTVQTLSDFSSISIFSLEQGPGVIQFTTIVFFNWN